MPLEIAPRTYDVVLLTGLCVIFTDIRRNAVLMI